MNNLTLYKLLDGQKIKITLYRSIKKSGINYVKKVIFRHIEEDKIIKELYNKLDELNDYISNNNKKLFEMVLSDLIHKHVEHDEIHVLENVINKMLDNKGYKYRLMESILNMLNDNEDLTLIKEILNKMANKHPSSFSSIMKLIYDNIDELNDIKQNNELLFNMLYYILNNYEENDINILNIIIFIEDEIIY